MSQSTLDYEVLSAAGTLMLTTPDRKLALRFAKARAADFPGIRVEIVERIVHRRVAWRQRKPADARRVGALIMAGAQ